MGPFPHDAPQAKISASNPAGTDGFEFVEFASPDKEKLVAAIEKMGFVAVARHKKKAITLYRQGDVNYLVNCEDNSFGDHFSRAHGPCAASMAWRVVDAKQAYLHAIANGAEGYLGQDKAVDAPAIIGIGGSLIYFIDVYGDKGSFYDQEFEWLGERNPTPVGLGFYYLDHLTHNVMRGNMDKWYEFYVRLFNFRQIRFFDIEGKLTGLFSRALTSPCGKIRIPINESADDKSQIEEYLRRYKGEGIQHIAVGTEDIYASTDALHDNGVSFMPKPPMSYYEASHARVHNHTESLEQLAKHGILIDGEGIVDGGETRILLQIFSKTLVGPIFFEFIQRKGDDGFGEGNFRALFESIEQDQIARGELKPNAAE